MIYSSENNNLNILKDCGCKSPGGTIKDITQSSSINNHTSRYDLISNRSVRNSQTPGNFTIYGPGTPENEIWKLYIKHIEGYLDVASMLALRQTCRLLYNHKYKIGKGELLFHGFMGYESKFVFDIIFPLVYKSLHHSYQHKLRLDLSRCILMRDISIVRMLDAAHRCNNKAEDDVRITNLRELNLDFCYKLSDKALEIMLTTQLPFLEKLSIRCVRNKNMTGIPFMRDLSSHNWPKFTQFCCSFSNIWLEPINVVADFIIRTAVNINNNIENRMTNKLFRHGCEGFTTSIPNSPLPASASAYNDGPNAANTTIIPSATSISDNMNVDESIYKLVEYLRKEPINDDLPRVTPVLEIFGSWGSRCLLESMGFSSHTRAFCTALKAGDAITCGKLAKTLHLEFESLAKLDEWKNNSTVQLLRNCGSELLVNSPLTITTTEHSGVDVWTLPISIAIQQEDHDTFNLLLVRGAKLNIWDYLGKSPLYRACEVERVDFVKLILNITLEPIVFDEQGLSALSIAIQKRNIEIVKLLLNSGAELNIKSPHVKCYKSPLYIACETNCPEIIQLLLDNGADPNWRFQLKLTPTLIAYRLDPSWLEIFIKFGAGTPRENRWVLTEVLSCAITKNDITSAKYLIDLFPDLLGREHDIWSKPHIQASKLGNLEILKYLTQDKSLLDNLDSSGTCALHAATEEGHLECIEYLLSAGADVNLCNKFDQNSLHLAVLENKYDVAKLLLEHKICVNQKDNMQGETPLMTCIRTRNESIGLLIVNNADNLDFNARDSMDRNCLMYALFFGQNTLSDLLAQKTPELTPGNNPHLVQSVNSVGNDKKKLRNILKIFWPKNATVEHTRIKTIDRVPSNTASFSLLRSRQIQNNSIIYQNSAIRSNSG